MDELIAKIEALLKSAFPGSEVTVVWSEDDPAERSVTAVVTWKGFEGIDSLERQREMWNAVKPALSEEERAQLIGLFAETPAERAALAKVEG